MRLIDRTGEKFLTNEGYEIEIVEYINFNNCTIKFLDGNVVKKVSLDSIKKGNVSNKNHKSLFGIGCVGYGKYKTTENKKLHKIYQTWGNLLSRCYTDKDWPFYKDVTVCNEWHNYQNFAKWYEENWKNYMQGWHLDKDILVKGNKIYSPETCCFVPQEVNTILLKPVKNNNIPTGISKRGDRFIAQLNKNGVKVHLGVFSDMEEAFNFYKKAKEAHIKEVADKWKDKIDSRVYEALIHYEI